MASYEQIYQHLCDRYDGDDVYKFFNDHENAVCKRRVSPLVEFLVEEIKWARYGRLQAGRDQAHAKAMTYVHCIATVMGEDYLRTYRTTVSKWADRLIDMAWKAVEQDKSAEQICDLLFSEIAVPEIREDEEEQES